MHRAKNYGLRFDEFGDTLDPAKLQEELRRLGLFTGTDSDGARFNANMAYAFDVEELEKLRVWRLAFLGRYCHQQAAFLRDTPIMELRSMIDSTIELMTRESSLQSAHETRA